ncbi:BQ5605_C027g10315 [Microbotryum silenes-dioicae]|uniref:BQ5605_C027g10315 protein n=1 Tax=Microbotryum silenes-dioicae TaxID=796604 RepID=A0A2X0MRA5_9BASI|nr:BQ5605_C027g10315 [Microbotryum silenes-dioicae]
MLFKQSSSRKSSSAVSMTATIEQKAPSKYEAKIPKLTRKLRTVCAMEDMAEAIRDVTGDRRLVGCDNLGTCRAVTRKAEVAQSGQLQYRKRSSWISSSRISPSSDSKSWGAWWEKLARDDESPENAVDLVHRGQQVLFRRRSCPGRTTYALRHRTTPAC